MRLEVWLLAVAVKLSLSRVVVCEIKKFQDADSSEKYSGGRSPMGWAVDTRVRRDPYRQFSADRAAD